VVGFHRAPFLSFFYRITEGIRITVRPEYSLEHSDPGRAYHLFIYHIRIENVGTTAARLTWRHWFIEDPVGGDQEVEGEGVVGVQPYLEPGAVYQYESYCVLRSPRGSMRGYYEFRRPDGSAFRADIPRFELRT
jgi:ApaG protein